MAVINITALTADGNELISLIGHPHRPPGAGQGVRAAGALVALQPPRRAAGCSQTPRTPWGAAPRPGTGSASSYTGTDTK